MTKVKIDWSKPVYCVGPCGRELRNRTKPKDYRVVHLAKNLCASCYHKIGSTIITTHKHNDTHQECVFCFEWLELHKFSSSKRYASGRDPRCYVCRNARRYGLSKTEYLAMKEEQKGSCYICKKRPTGTGRGNYLYLDHCHKTNAIRKMLCMSCNISLGHFKDDICLLNTAINYLNRPSIRFPLGINEKGELGTNQKGRGASLWDNYKIRLSGFNWIIEVQNDRCPICKHPTPKSVDHNHNCCDNKKSCGNCIRGIICKKCNAGLGNAKDSPEILQSMINYLKEYVV